MTFLKDASFVAGHNVIRHDLKYLEKEIEKANLKLKVIDTLDLAPLMFPARPYKSLVKDDKLQTKELNFELSFYRRPTYSVRVYSIVERD